jgi:hypothetical protein
VTLEVTPANGGPPDPFIEIFTTVSDENGLIRALSNAQGWCVSKFPPLKHRRGLRVAKSFCKYADD